MFFLRYYNNVIILSILILQEMTGHRMLISILSKLVNKCIFNILATSKTNIKIHRCLRQSLWNLVYSITCSHRAKHFLVMCVIMFGHSVFFCRWLCDLECLWMKWNISCVNFFYFDIFLSFINHKEEKLCFYSIARAHNFIFVLSKQFLS